MGHEREAAAAPAAAPEPSAERERQMSQIQAFLTGLPPEEDEEEGEDGDNTELSGDGDVAPAAAARRRRRRSAPSAAAGAHCCSQCRASSSAGSRHKQGRSKSRQTNWSFVPLEGAAAAAAAEPEETGGGAAMASRRRRRCHACGAGGWARCARCCRGGTCCAAWLEIFLAGGTSHLLCFDDREARRRVHQRIVALRPPLLEPDSLNVHFGRDVLETRHQALIEDWQNWRISNFEYLMRLNTLAGRSHNDLTQYPVMPWVLADYTSTELDLSDPASYRDLSKPMGAQEEGRAAKFKERFDTYQDCGMGASPSTTGRTTRRRGSCSITYFGWSRTRPRTFGCRAAASTSPIGSLIRSHRRGRRASKTCRT